MPDSAQRAWPGWLLPVAIWGTGIALLVLPLSYLQGVDAHYHVRLSEIMSRQGWVLDAFPWATQSIWSDNFFDKEWLFHVLLIPLLPLGMLMAAKVSIVLYNLLMIACIWWALKAAGHRAPGWLICLIPILGYTSFLERLVLYRPHLLSICILFASLAALAGRRRWLIGLFSLIYALCYTGHWQLLGIVFIYDVLYTVLDDEGKRRPTLAREWPMLLPAAIGMLIGEVVHPQFPANVHGMFVQNVLVLRDYWGGNVPAVLTESRPFEIRAGSILSFLGHHAVLLLGLAALAWHALKSRSRLLRMEWLYLILTCGYMVMTSRSMRFSEYFVAVGACALGLYWHRFGIMERLPKPAFRKLLVGAFVVFGVVSYAVQFSALQEIEKTQQHQERYAVTAEWLATQAEAGEVVFATSWSDNPYLFYGAGEQRYLVFLDIYFMYAKDPKKLQLWHDIRTGQAENPVDLIRQEFDSTLVFTQQHPMFQEFAKQLFAAGGKIVKTGPHGDVLIRLPE